MDKYIAEILTTTEEEVLEAPVVVARKVKFEVDEKEGEGEEEEKEEEEEEEEQVRPIFDRFRTCARYGLLAADTSEELCGDIFSRLAGEYMCV